MDKKIFKSILWMVTIAILLVAVIIKLDSVLAILKTVGSLLAPVFWGIGIAFIIYPMFVFFKDNLKKLFTFFKRKNEERKAKRASVPARSTKKRSFISPEMAEKIEKINLYRKEQRELKQQSLKGKKRQDIGVTVLALIIAYAILIAVVAVSILLLVPQLGVSVTLLANNLNSYIGNLQSLLDKFSSAIGLEASLDTALEDLLNTVLVNLSRIITDLLPKILDFTKNLALVLSNMIIGLIMSVYMVIDKDLIVRKISQIFRVILPEKAYLYVANVTRLTSNIFSGYISSRLLDSLIVGIICYICMVILGFDYPLLISVVVGITNIIPVFGPFMGAIPSAFILLMIDPMEAVWFSIFILILQQIDGNIISPMITGDSIGLPVIWTMIAILVGGGLFGVMGMLFGVPAIAVVYRLVNDEIQNRIKANEEKLQKTK